MADYVSLLTTLVAAVFLTVIIMTTIAKEHIFQADTEDSLNLDNNFYVHYPTKNSSGIYSGEPLKLNSEIQVIFRANTEGYSVFRLPAIVYHQGTLLAFCEGRKGTADKSVSEIIMKRGLVSGTKITWDKTLTSIARINDTRLANPVPIVDTVTHTILVAYNVLPANVDEDEFIMQDHYNQSLLLIQSNDQGETWSEPTNITDETLGQMRPAPSFYAPGPGHGIQMKSGRLVLQGNFYRRDNEANHKTYKYGTSDHSSVFLSDDHGKNWRPGGYVPYGEDEQGKPIRTSESTVVELANDTLCINSRTQSKSQHRSQSFSLDGGLTFNQPELSETLTEPSNFGGLTSGCEGSVLGFLLPHNVTGYTSPSNNEQLWTLFSNPVNRLFRVQMSIRLSTDGCQTWSEPWTIWNPASGYSDMVQLEYLTNSGNNNDPMFAIFFESGYIDPVSTLSFMTFTLKDVINGIKARE